MGKSIGNGISVGRLSDELNDKTNTETNKKILSWDVGIKNLAYCILTKNDDEFKIGKWGVINLVEDRQKCEFILKTGNQCTDVAKSCVYHTDKIDLFSNCQMKFCCNKHKDKMIPTLTKISDMKDKPKNLKKCILCEDKPTYVLDMTDYCWCDEHYEKKAQTFCKKVKTKRVSVVGCMKQPLQELSEKLFSKLDKEFPDFVDVDRVIIENQPTLRNPTMKTLASILYSYFVMRGIIDKEKTNSKIEEVRFVSPSNKLKVNQKNTDKVLSGGNKTEAYKMTKKLGIKYCKALLNKSDLETVNKVKKQDDMCDAFLQGFQHLFNPVPEKYFKKLQEIGFDENVKPNKSKKNDSEN